MNKYHYFIMPFELDESFIMQEIERKEHFITVLAKDYDECEERIKQYLDNNNLVKSLCISSEPNSKLSTFKKEIQEWAKGGNINPNIFD